MTVNTQKVERRHLRFDNLQQLRDELDRIERADQEGKLTAIGNWSPGQILSHVAAWIAYGWDGYPVKSPPFFVKWILKLLRGKYMKNGMPSGVKIPGVEGGTTGQDTIALSEGVARLRNCIDRLERGELAKFDSPAFGPMNHQDRITFNLRHAELHLSFLKYD